MASEPDNGELRYGICLRCGDAVNFEDIDHVSGICRYCVMRAETFRKGAEERAAAKKALQDIIGQSRPNRIDAPHVTELFGAIVDQFGGLQSAVQLLLEDYFDARERTPGGTAALRFWEGFIRLSKESSAQRSTAPDAVNMTDEQLASEMLALVEQTARRNRLGYSQKVLVEALLDERRTPENEGADDGAGSGEPGPPDGSPSLLPPNPEATDLP